MVPARATAKSLTRSMEETTRAQAGREWRPAIVFGVSLLILLTHQSRATWQRFPSVPIVFRHSPTLSYVRA